MSEPIEIPEGDRPSDFLMRQMRNLKPAYRPLRSLEEAREAEHGSVVIEGDWGGTIYLSCPVKYFDATHAEIKALAEWLERSFWDCNFDHHGMEGGQGVYYRDALPGVGILGGMGGGIHEDGLWVHPGLGEDVVAEIKAQLKLKDVE